MVLRDGHWVQLAVLGDLGAGEALGAHALDVLLELVDLGARSKPALGRAAQRLDDRAVPP